MKQYLRPLIHTLSGAVSLALLLLVARPAHAWVTVAEPGADLRALATDVRGCVTVAGQLTDRSGGNSLYVARYSASGKLLWRAAEAGGTFDQPAQGAAVATDAKGDVYVAGALPLSGTVSLPVVAKYSGTSGKRLWLTAADPRSGLSESLALDSMGRVTVSGYVIDADGPHGWVARLSGSGALLWGWSPSYGEIRDVAVDANGDVYGTGRLLAVKLSGPTGAELWRMENSGTQNAALGFPLMRSITVDGTGRVVVGGALSNSLEETRVFYVAALNAVTGAVTWEQAGAPVYGGDTATDVVVDPSGKLLTAGELSGQPSVLCLNPTGGSATWTAHPWPGDPLNQPVPAVAAMCADSRAAYASGVTTGGAWAVAGVNRTGTIRWQQNLGLGRVAAQGVDTHGHLFLAGRLTAKDGSQPAVVIGLTSATGKQLPGGSK